MKLVVAILLLSVGTIFAQTPNLLLRGSSLALNDNDPVATWADESASGNDATQADSGKRPIYKASGPNGKPYVLFDGVDNYLKLDAAFTLTDGIIYIVCSPTAPVATTDGMALLGRESGTQPHGAMVLGNASSTAFTDEITSWVRFEDAGSTVRGAASTLALSGWNILSLRISGGTIVEMRQNGMLVDETITVSSAGNLNATTYTFNAIDVIGALRSDAYFFAGGIAEVRKYDDLTGAEQRSIFTSLGSTYGITISSTTAAGLTRSQVVTAAYSAMEDETVNLPAGSANWSAGFTWTVLPGITLKGAGSTSTLGGGDSTTFIDDIASNTRLFQFATLGSFRLAGTTFQTGTGVNKDNGTIAFSGTGPLRIDHCHFDMEGTPLYFYLLPGVMDHNLLELGYASRMFFANGRGTSGNAEWTTTTGWSSNEWFFIEDNVFVGAFNVGNDLYGTQSTDAGTGAKFVIRFNTFTNQSIMDAHGTGHSGYDRGIRGLQVYGNQVYYDGAHIPPIGAGQVASGSALIWGNRWESAYRNFIFKLETVRRSDETYFLLNHPDGWGYAGARASNVVDVAANDTDVTRVSGDNFNTSWPSGVLIVIGGHPRRIAAVASANALTLQAPVTGLPWGNEISVANSNDVVAVVGSPWDGNTTARGYPALDQVGRGAGDLITGTFPTMINSQSGIASWPNQVLEPVYFWDNGVPGTTTGPGGPYSPAVISDNTDGLATEDQDYYLPVSGIQTTSSSPFDGSTGVGWGTLANRPASPSTTNVAYFATDQGSWNTSTSNPYGVQQNGADGVLYQWNGSSWVTYYTPYVYPHPLQNITNLVVRKVIDGGSRLDGRIQIQ